MILKGKLRLDGRWQPIEISVAVWSIYRRELALSDVGAAVATVMDSVLPLLPIGEEGIAVFDLSTVRHCVQTLDYWFYDSCQ
jgi:hypothetical protein